MRRFFLVGFLALSLSACASAQAPRTYSGVYDVHFETSSFTSHDGQGPFWLVAEGATQREITAPLQRTGGPPWGAVEVVVEGWVTPPGHYGHMAAYARELHVTRVISSRLVRAEPPPSGS